MMEWSEESQQVKPTCSLEYVQDALNSDHPLLLLVGSGCHHYLRGQKVKYPNPRKKGAVLSDWKSLLTATNGGNHPPPHTDNTFIWETILAQNCQENGSGPAQKFEDELLERVRELIIKATPPLNDRRLRKFGMRLKKSGVKNVVTLNFDRTLDRALPRKSGKENRVVRPNGEIGTYRAKLYVEADGVTVWHAHGMARKNLRLQSIQLSVVSYADTVAALIKLYNSFTSRRKVWRKNQEPSLSSESLYWAPGLFKKWAKETADRKENWLDHFLTANVIILGCGLSQAETDVWFALHARQRELASVPDADRPQTFFLHPLAGFPAHLTTAPAGIRPVVTDSFDHAWSIVLPG